MKIMSTKFVKCWVLKLLWYLFDRSDLYPILIFREQRAKWGQISHRDGLKHQYHRTCSNFVEPRVEECWMIDRLKYVKQVYEVQKFSVVGAVNYALAIYNHLCDSRSEYYWFSSNVGYHSILLSLSRFSHKFINQT